MSIVGTLMQDFNTAAAQITASETAYSAASAGLEEAVGGVLARYSPILQSLQAYQSASAGIAESDLKRRADGLHNLLNTTFSTGTSVINTSLIVSHFMATIHHSS